jgi:excisionase family DNA binding protein
MDERGLSRGDRTYEERVLLRVPEAARRLGISTSQAYELARRGELPGVVRLGGAVRVSVRLIEEWIDTHDSVSPPPSERVPQGGDAA